MRVSGSSSLLRRYDGPEILPSSIHPCCLIGADVGHRTPALVVHFPDNSSLEFADRNCGAVPSPAACQLLPCKLKEDYAYSHGGGAFNTKVDWCSARRCRPRQQQFSTHATSQRFGARFNRGDRSAWECGGYCCDAGQSSLRGAAVWLVENRRHPAARRRADLLR